LRRTDYQVNQTQETDCHHGEDKEQRQNQNDFATADVQQGETGSVSIHMSGLKVVVRLILDRIVAAFQPFRFEPCPAQKSRRRRTRSCSWVAQTTTT
jgi:hypothetical protein